MSFAPRPYQQDAIDINVKFFKTDDKLHGLEILPTGSGKSVVIANTAMNLKGNTVIFQPSKEILEQNYAKFISYGYRASIYSASLKQNHIDRVTFATIGSVARKKYLFRNFENIIIDECHLVNAEDGMYREFIDTISSAKVLGLTATPYRLTSTAEGSMLNFLTNTTPRVFKRVLYYVQNDVLFNNDFLAPLEYYCFNVIDRGRLETNAKGTDFTEESLRRYLREINMAQKIARYTNMVLSKRKNCLVFCSMIDEARDVVKSVPGSRVITGDTDGNDRENILKDFLSGKIRCVVNVGVLTTGFDFPALEAVVLGRSTMSLSYHYQTVGRVMRPYTYSDGSIKTGWVVDLAGNTGLFGKIESLRIEQARSGFYVSNNGRRLTDVGFSKK